MEKNFSDMLEIFCVIRDTMATKEDLAELEEKVDRNHAEINEKVDRNHTEMLEHVDGFIGLSRGQE